MPNDLASKVVRPPMLGGVDTTQDSRITAPGTWKQLVNLYARSPGVLAVRPGSQIIATTIVAPGRAAEASLVVAGASTQKWGFTWIVSKSALNFPDLATAMPPVSQQRGVHSLWPVVHASPIPIDTTLPTSTANSQAGAGHAQYITGISRVFRPGKNRSYWIGSARREPPHNDVIWWFDETNNNMRAMPVLEGHISGSSDNFQFLPVHGKTSAADGTTPLAFATNGAGRPLVIFNNTTYPNDPFEIKAAHIRTSVNDGTDLSPFDVCNVRSMCMYGGQVVIGGFGLFDEDAAVTTLVRNYANCIAFIDTDIDGTGSLETATIGGVTAFQLAADSGSGRLYFVRVGEDLSEPVVAVVPVSTITDSDGVAGGLAVLTTKKVAIYRNPPPTSGNPNGQDFHHTALGDIGCASRDSVARTPWGVVFLGTDGLFYLIALDNSVRPISRAIAAEFQGLSPRHLAKVVGIYDGEFYKVFYPVRGQAAGKKKIDIKIGTASSDTLNYAKPPHNTMHFYADMRYIDRAAKDEGVMWYGPHDGLNISCAHRANDIEDYGFILAGTSHTVGLIQLNRYDLRTDPAMNALSGSTRRFPWLAESNEYDLGDIHMDKTVTALRIGLRTTANFTADIGCAAFGDVSEKSLGFSKSVAVVAPGTALDPGPLADGTEPYQSESSMSLPVSLPGEVVRGKVFQLSIRETAPAGNNFVSISDIEVTILEHPARRSTG